MLTRDVGPCLVPPRDTPVPQAQPEAFLAHMAERSWAFWGWSDDIGLTTTTQRLRLPPRTTSPGKRLPTGAAPLSEFVGSVEGGSN